MEDLVLLLLQVLLGSFAALVVWWLVAGDSDFATFVFQRFGADTAKYFDGKVIWITGASSGIGESMALALAAKSRCRLILSARRVAELHRVKTLCLESNWELSSEDVSVFPLDLTDFPSLGDAAERAFEVFGRLDVLVHNAGRSQRAEWEYVEVSVDEECMRLNAFGPVLLTRALLPRLLGQASGAQLVVVSSISGVIGAPLSPSYTAAKHALNGYFRTLWVEKADTKLKVNLVCPALTYSPNNPASAFTGEAGAAHGQLVPRPTKNHMLPQRAAELILSAAANDQAEAWLSHRKKVLLLAYLSVVSPGLARLAVRLVGPQNLRKTRAGDD